MSDGTGFSADDRSAKRDALSRLRDAVSSFVQNQSTAPLDPSPAVAELRSFARQESLETAQAQTWPLLEVASDQLTAFVKTITEPVEAMAPYTCTRSLLEAAALACWLLDPSIDTRTRVGRSVALRHEGLMQQVKWARAAGQDSAYAQRRVDHVVATAAKMGYPPVVDVRGRSIGAGQRMPSGTEIIGLMLEEEPLYRLLSAVAHGHHWARQQLSFERAPAFDRVSDVSGARLAGVTKAANLTSFAMLVLTAAVSLSRAAWYQGRYVGWDTNALCAILDARFDSLGATTSVRFWRPAA